MITIGASWAVAKGLFSQSMVGGGLILISVAAGWMEGGRNRWPAHLIGWWLDRVVHHILAQSSWLLRSLSIALNNALACGLMVVGGALGLGAWAFPIVIGFMLGLAVRRLNLAVSVPDQATPDEEDAQTPPLEEVTPNVEESRDGPPLTLTPREQMLGLAGLALNLLEIPAILLSAGLCLGQEALWPAIDLHQAMGCFAVFVTPILLVAAGGEALWMGVYRVEAGDIGH